MTNIELMQGDITKLKIDVIVNAANSSLMGGGGVDGAIHRAGESKILDECKEIRAKQGGCNTGEAVITSGGNLPSKYVIHTVGPIWNGGNRDEKIKLANCYKNSLKLAISNKCKVIAFPNISTGIYAYPKKEAAEIAVNTIKDFIKSNQSIEKIIFICFDKENYSHYKKLLI